jgi:hypothetical protein
MASFPATATGVKKTVSPRHAILESLIGIVIGHVNDQLLPLSGRLEAALHDTADMADDAAIARLRFQAANLLNQNIYTFLRLISTNLERTVRQEIARLAPAPIVAAVAPVQTMSLVPYEEMDSRVALSAVSAPFEAMHADVLAALDVRLACLLDRDMLRSGQNPFRPEVFLIALQEAWSELVSDAELVKLLPPLLKPALLPDLAPILDALNLALMKNGVLPGSLSSYKGPAHEAREASSKTAPASPAMLVQQLRQFLQSGGRAQEPQGQDFGHDFDMTIRGMETLGGAGRGRSKREGAVAGERQSLLSHLARLQQAEPVESAHNVIYLPKLKGSLPKGSLTRADESTIDLLSAIFETVFSDQNISQETRDLIGFLQVPVLKAALADQDFFFQEAHPARRLIDLLSHMGWEQRANDPMFAAMQRSVERIGRDCERQPEVFSEVLAELEESIQADQQAATAAIAEPIQSALKQEKMAQAARSAADTVALRVGSGEVLAFIETFLENKWVPVLTIAYSVKDEKPGAVQHAIQTMDELIWSTKPKQTAQDRRQLIGKLPAMLVVLNKWLDIVKWQDTDRLQFFAELAECHASLVRAPLDLSPERQVEISLQVAQQAAQRRIERQSRSAPEPEVVFDAAAQTIDTLRRGMWIEVAQADGLDRKVKLAWISPLRTLFIFSNDSREEAFSMAGEALAVLFRAGRARLIETDGLVGRALSQAMAQVAVNDACINQVQGAV